VPNLPTHRRTMPWTIEIWSNSTLIVAPKNNYAAFVTSTVEGIIKEFVNDWTAAQELEDLWVPPRQ
jgi:hypothetical protein